MSPEELWRAATLLRGAVDALAYKDLVLGLLLLRWPGRLATPVPWSALRGAPAAAMDAALAAMEAADPALAGALPPRFDAAGLAPDRLAALYALVDSAPEGDLGRVYESFLARFSREAGRGGEFYTPSGVVALLHALVPPTGRVYDPCCGMGGLLDGATGEVYGQESNPATWRLARVNLARQGLAARLGERPADSLRDDLHPGLRADVALANPPFNLAGWGRDELAGDHRWSYGLPPASNANFAWIQHILAHLAPTGRAAVILANGALTAGRGGEGEIRRRLVAEGRVTGVVALPERLFFTTIIPASVWILGPPAERVVFVDATRLGRMATRAWRVLDPADVTTIATAFLAAAAGEEGPLARAVPVGEVLETGGLLTPGRYVRGGGHGAAEGGQAGDACGPVASGELQRAASALLLALDEARAGEARLREALRALGGAGDDGAAG